jgi:hypothetical protein
MIWYDIFSCSWVDTGGSSTVHIYKQTIHRTTQLTKTIHRTTQFTNYKECGPCPIFVMYTLAFALQLRRKHGKASVRVAGEWQLLWNWTEVYKEYNHIHNNKKERTKRTSLHCNTSPHFTQLHITTLIDTSLHHIYTSLPSHLAQPIYISYSSNSPRIAKLDTIQFSHLQTYFQNNEPLHCPKEPLTI